MGETQTIDSRSMTPEMVEHQSVLQKLWQELNRLPKIRVSEAIEARSVLPIPQGTRRVSETVMGLEEGKLVAVRGLNSQPEFYDLFCLDTDARFGTEYPLKPIITWHDPDNPDLPVPIRVEKWPFGFKINWGSRSRGWTAYHQGEAAYYNLTEAVANEAKEVCASIRGNAPLGGEIARRGTL